MFPGDGAFPRFGVVETDVDPFKMTKHRSL